MNMFTMMVFAAAALTLMAFVTGILAMISNGEVGHFESGHWMGWRVGFQALAVVLVLMAMNAPH